jgi:ABC-type phosphate transport system ATPase subunit
MSRKSRKAIIFLFERERTKIEVPPLLQFRSKLAVIVITHDVNQLARVATLPARLLMFTGRIYKTISLQPLNVYEKS